MRNRLRIAAGPRLEVVRRITVHLATVLSCLLGIAPAVRSQDVAGHFQARVLSSDGAALGDLMATASGTSLPVRRAVTSDAAGRLRLLGLPPGRYDILLVSIGFRPRVLRDVPVLPGRTTDAGEIRMEPQQIALDTLVVPADRSFFDPRSTAVGATLGAATFEDLPTGRSYLSVVSLLPQASESFYGDGLNIAGRTGLESAIYVDGIHVTEPYKGAGGLTLPFNFIADVQLRTGGYEAEYGRALGGIVNVVTRSGGDAFRASTFGFYTGSSLSGGARRGFLDIRSGGFRRYDAGLSLSGPLTRGRAWFFAAYDASVGSEDVATPVFGVRTDRTLTHHFAGKLTWQATPRTILDFSLIGDPTARDVIGNTFWLPIFQPDSLANVDPFLGRQRQGGWAASLSARRTAGRGTLVEASLSRLDTHNEDRAATERGATEALRIAFGSTGQTWSGGYGNFFDHHSVRTAASLAVTHHRGEHSIKAGVQLEDNLLDEDWRWIGDGPRNAGMLLGAPPVDFMAFVLDFRTRVHNRVASAFAQGSIRVNRYLRFNPGLRWDGQYLSGVASGLSGSITDQWQPRLGVILYPDASERQKLTASFARYYEQLGGLPVSFWFGPLEQDINFYAPDSAGNTQETLFRAHNRPLDHLEGQHYNEVTLGYERTGRHGTVAGRLVHRALRQILTSFALAPDTNYGGNPAAFGLPAPRGNYLALELSASSPERANPRFLASYVLSRNRGNYVGLYDTDAGVGNPHSGSNWTNLLELQNAYGPLPNDRPHAFKLLGSYRFRFGLTAGAYATVQSGTPLNELGANRTSPFDFVFLRPRGSAGRTPTLWDLNVHMAYEVRGGGVLSRSRVLLDAQHLFSQRKPVHLNQMRFLAVDSAGNQTTPNPNYLRPIAYQPPTNVRLGFQADF